MHTVDFYFDFMSPYAYLASTQIPSLMERHASRAVFQPHAIDLWEARLASGNNGPSNRTMPRKFKCLMADVNRWAKRYKVPIGAPKAFDAQRLNRAFWVARGQSHAKSVKFMTSAFRMVWGESGDPTSVDLMKAAAAEAEIDGDAVVANTDTAATVALYRSENLQAQERGVFGAPFFIVGSEIFWGNDRIGFVEEELYKPVAAQPA
jgi:2-hydroxychromene-2-carboxylate isomerase